MDELTEGAARLMEVLQAGAESGTPGTNWVVFVGPEGGYHMIADYEGSLGSLGWDRGARRAWSVRQQGGRLVVEGQAAGARCVIARDAPQRQTLRMVSHASLYRV